MGGIVKIGRRIALQCYCCGCRSRPAPDEQTAARWARLGHWDTPGRCEDGEPYEGYFRCPRCVDLGRWPLETDGFFAVEAAVPGAVECTCALTDGPVIRLADGDLAADVVLDAMPDALITGGQRP